MKPARGVTVTHRGGRSWQLGAPGWTLRVVADNAEEVRHLAELLSALERSRRGGLVAALAAMASIRAVRDEKPGAVNLRLGEAAGDPAFRPSDWEVSAEVKPARRRTG